MKLFWLLITLAAICGFGFVAYQKGSITKATDSLVLDAVEAVDDAIQSSLKAIERMFSDAKEGGEAMGGEVKNQLQQSSKKLDQTIEKARE